MGSRLGTVAWEARGSRRFGCEARSSFYIKLRHRVVFFEEFLELVVSLVMASETLGEVGGSRCALVV